MSVNGLAARPAPPTAGIKQSTPPNQTLYVNNLADKVHKDDMIRSLYLLFSAQAHILDVVVMKTGKTRGQAHVVFEDQFAATQAMRALQGVEFLGKPIVSPPSIPSQRLFDANASRCTAHPVCEGQV